MDFRQLRYITAVADNRSITKAAQALYISQPSLSHFISKTEAELGVLLFNRRTSPISLTYAGEKYVESARNILMISEQLSKELRDISNNMKGRLRVGMPPDRASYMLPQILPAFKERFPGIDLQLESNKGEELLKTLIEGQLDFMILPISVQDRDIKTTKIYEEELLLVAGKGVIKPEQLLDCERPTVDPAKLSGMPFFLQRRGHLNRASVEGIFRDYNIKPSATMEADSNSATYRMAAQGLGLAVVPFLTTQIVKTEYEPALYLLGKPPVTWAVNAIYHRDTYIGLVEQTFFDIARELFS